MSLNSVNTNLGAMVALQSLNRTNEALNTTQKRVSTGYRVSDAKDDGAAFAVAQSVRADVAGLTAANEQLGGVKGGAGHRAGRPSQGVRHHDQGARDPGAPGRRHAQHRPARPVRIPVRGAAHADHELHPGLDLQRPHPALHHPAGGWRHHHHPQRGRHDLYADLGGWRRHHDRRGPRPPMRRRRRPRSPPAATGARSTPSSPMR
jgi:hypothetical protein